MKKLTTDKDKALELAFAAIEKAHGKGTILHGKDSVPGVEFFSTGIFSLDKALGGGWARGRIIELIAAESTGKTTLALHAVKEVQLLGERAAYVDIEHALDIKYMANLGVNVDNLIISQPDSGEQAISIVEELVNSTAISLIVIDSVAALVPQKELEGDFSDQNMGLQARLMSKAMRVLSGSAHKTDTTLLFLNQYRSKIGLVFGNPNVGTGGSGLKYFSSQRVELSKTGVVKEGEEIVASEIKAKVIKNKVAPPFREATFNIKYGAGVDIYGDIFTLAVNKNIIKKAGSWFSYKDNNIGQGQGQAIRYLLENEDIYKEIISQL